MSEHIRIGDPAMAIALRRSDRARRMVLRLSPVTGEATLTLPRRVTLAEGLRFAESQRDWLARQIARHAAPDRIGIGSSMPLRGESVVLANGTGRQVRHQDGQLLVPGDPALAGRRVLGWLKAQARADLSRSAQFYAGRLGREYTAIKLRDTRSRWGSCSAQGALMFSWRLILAPPEVLDYVAAHEVAHLQELNHSPDFWAVVAGLMPGHETHRRWLKANGAGLHRHVFG